MILLIASGLYLATGTFLSFRYMDWSDPTAILAIALWPVLIYYLATDGWQQKQFKRKD